LLCTSEREAGKTTGLYLSHPSYSSDLAQCDLPFERKVSKHQFQSAEEITTATRKAIHDLLANSGVSSSYTVVGRLAEQPIAIMLRKDVDMYYAYLVTQCDKMTTHKLLAVAVKMHKLKRMVHTSSSDSALNISTRLFLFPLRS
jgi:hypothetical protein